MLFTYSAARGISEPRIFRAEDVQGQVKLVSLIVSVMELLAPVKVFTQVLSCSINATVTKHLKGVFALCTFIEQLVV